MQATACRAVLGTTQCPGFLERCARDAKCAPASGCLVRHDVASMAEARHCFPSALAGDVLTLAECLADLLPQRQPPTCRGRHGNAVDWAFSYKLPGGLYYACATAPHGRPRLPRLPGNFLKDDGCSHRP